ncbi:MAG: IS3 family transposase [Desulfuromonadales bacterium]|nr:IS3 family transposase [Desulfuromonadales bacterium]
MNTNKRYSPEVRERAVRLVLEQQGEYSSRWSAICSIAEKIGCTPETLRRWCKEEGRSQKSGLGAQTERELLKQLERENRELKRANEILRKAAAFFAPGGARPQTEVMVTFINEHRSQYGVEPICAQLPIAPSTYYHHRARQTDPSKIPLRNLRDQFLKPHIQRVWKENYQVYGARKVWLQLNREGIFVARCTVERRMREMCLRGVVRGKKQITTISDPKQERAPDLVKRNFKATRPNQLRVADFTYVATWSGFVYVAFVIDVFARSIVGWRVSNSMKTALVLDALEQALWARQNRRELIHHSDRGSQYLSIHYTERLADANISASVGTTGDSYDNALAETIIGLYKTEVIHHRGPWKGRESVEYATLEWVDWFNNRRLLEPIGNIPPAEREMEYYRLEESNEAA